MSGLRGYQVQLLDDASAHFRAGARRVLIQAPTGSGKTTQTAHMLRSAASKGMPSVFIVHRRELLQQASRTFTEAGVRHGLIAAGFEPAPSELVQIASIATLARQRHALRRPRFMVWDEAHHLPAPGWASLQDEFGDAFHVGLTATPVRLDGRGLREFFDVIVPGPSVTWLQRRGYLVACHHFAPRSVDLSRVRIRMGDFDKSQLASAMQGSTINQDAVAAYLAYARGTRALVFAVSIDQSEAAVAAFNAAGIAAEHVDGKTPAAERDAAIARFEAGQTHVLSNVDLFGEGFDLPALECVIMLRATWSLSLFLQMIGRALRPTDGKTAANILDLVGNWRRHGMVEEDRRWSLDPSPPTFEPRTDLQVCDNCALVRPRRPFCSACGLPQRPHRSDDAEAWSALAAQPGIAARLRSLPYGRAIAWGTTEQELRMVALARGFKPGWAFHRARERSIA